MPNIGIHGWQDEEAQKLRGKIDECLQDIGLGEDAVTEIFLTDVQSCNGKKTRRPYIRLFSTEIKHIPAILTQFQNEDIHEDVEVLYPPMFFEGKEIASAEWMEKFASVEKASRMTSPLGHSITTQSIEVLEGLSRRSFNVLRNAGFKTIGEIMEKTNQELSMIKGFGPKTFKEVCNSLESLGLHRKRYEL